MTERRRALIDVDLPSGPRARVFVSEHVIGYRVNGLTTIAHHRAMSPCELAALAQCITELEEIR